MASLPKFQHAFGRQLYQGIDGGTGVVVSGTGNNDSGSQFGTAISERTTRGKYLFLKLLKLSFLVNLNNELC